ncbi:hypothetical protein H0H93_006674 [Arthromyces matolae]|nr:hypothetical protein H0H93_006674 [Arthromyces matolae]
MVSGPATPKLKPLLTVKALEARSSESPKPRPKKTTSPPRSTSSSPKSLPLKDRPAFTVPVKVPDSKVIPHHGQSVRGRKNTSPAKAPPATPSPCKVSIPSAEFICREASAYPLITQKDCAISQLTMAVTAKVSTEPHMKTLRPAVPSKKSRSKPLSGSASLPSSRASKVDKAGLKFTVTPLACGELTLTSHAISKESICGFYGVNTPRINIDPVDLKEGASCREERLRATYYASPESRLLSARPPSPLIKAGPHYAGSWFFTVVRTHGMRLMRPEKSWRPIVTVEVDQHHCHETIMGVDGQNPNLRERFELRHVHNASQVDIRVWHRPQSKKKAKKRKLVAYVSHSLGELLRQREKEPRKELELRLQCHSATKNAISSRGRPQNGATVLLKIHTPANMESFRYQVINDELTNGDVEAESSTSGSSSRSPSIPPSPTDDTWPGVGTTIRRRRRKGYDCNSDDEACFTDVSESDGKPPVFSDADSQCEDQADFWDNSTLHDDDRPLVKQPSGNIIRFTVSKPTEWIQTIWPSVLPQYTERIEISQDLSFAERLLASFTTYSELRAARTDSEYEKVFVRLQTEWTYMGGLLVALAAIGEFIKSCVSVDSAVFAIAPGSIFDVQTYARIAIAASSIFSGLGIASDAWFLFRYNWADLHTFITRARDVYSSYFFFALSARVPALCTFCSATALMVFMGLVAFEVWPTGVLLTCFVIGIVMTLQFLVFGAHWCVLRIVGTVRWVVRLLGKLFGASKPTSEEDNKAGQKEKGKEVELPASK